MPSFKGAKPNTSDPITEQLWIIQLSPMIVSLSILTPGYITTLSIITGLYLAGAKKEIYIASLLAILISDPLSHLFAFNISSSVLEWEGVLYQLIVNLQIILR